MARALAAAVGPMGKLLKTTGRILAENIHFNLSPCLLCGRGWRGVVGENDIDFQPDELGRRRPTRLGPA